MSGRGRCGIVNTFIAITIKVNDRNVFRGAFGILANHIDHDFVRKRAHVGVVSNLAFVERRSWIVNIWIHLRIILFITLPIVTFADR